MFREFDFCRPSSGFYGSVCTQKRAHFAHEMRTALVLIINELRDVFARNAHDLRTLPHDLGMISEYGRFTFKIILKSFEFCKRLKTNKIEQIGIYSSCG